MSEHLRSSSPPSTSVQLIPFSLLMFWPLMNSVGLPILLEPGLRTAWGCPFSSSQAYEQRGAAHSPRARLTNSVGLPILLEPGLRTAWGCPFSSSQAYEQRGAAHSPRARPPQVRRKPTIQTMPCSVRCE